MDEAVVEEVVKEAPTTSDVMSDIYAKLVGNDPGTAEEKEDDLTIESEESEEVVEDDEEREIETKEINKEGTEPKGGDLKAPKDWPKDVREGFPNLPEESQKFLLNSYKGMQGDYTRKTQAIADVTRALDPVRSIMQSRNIPPGQAISQLVELFLEVHSNPVKGIQKVANAYNLDLESISTYWDNPDEFADTDSVKKNNAEMNAKAKPEVTDADRKAYAEKLAEFEEWSQDKEFIEQVQDEMADLAAVEQMRGIQPSSFDVLYEKACRLNPEVNEILVDRQANGSLEESAKEKKIRAAKAEKAAKSLKSTSHEGAPRKRKEPKSTEEAMRQAWDELT